MQKNPANRYASMAEMSRKVQAALRHEPAPAPPPKPAMPRPAERVPPVPTVKLVPMQVVEDADASAAARAVDAPLRRPVRHARLVGGAVRRCSRRHGRCSSARPTGRRLTDTFFLTAAASWAVILPSRLWSGIKSLEDSWTRRLVLMCCGFGVGLFALWLDGYTLPMPWTPAGQVDALQPWTPPEGEHPHAHPFFTSLYRENRSMPLMACYLGYFGLMFLVLRWWRSTEPTRGRRFSLKPVIATVFWGYILLFLLPSVNQRHTGAGGDGADRGGGADPSALGVSAWRCKRKSADCPRPRGRGGWRYDASHPGFGGRHAALVHRHRHGRPAKAGGPRLNVHPPAGWPREVKGYGQSRTMPAATRSRARVDRIRGYLKSQDPPMDAWQPDEAYVANQLLDGEGHADDDKLDVGGIKVWVWIQPLKEPPNWSEMVRLNESGPAPTALRRAADDGGLWAGDPDGALGDWLGLSAASTNGRAARMSKWLGMSAFALVARGRRRLVADDVSSPRKDRRPQGPLPRRAVGRNVWLPLSPTVGEGLG